MKSKSPLHKIRALKGMRSRDDGGSSSASADVMHLDTIVTRCDPKAIDGTYRHAPAALHVPRQIDACPGISFFGRRVKSLVFSTDLAIICNCDADGPCSPCIPSPASPSSHRGS